LQPIETFWLADDIEGTGVRQGKGQSSHAGTRTCEVIHGGKKCPFLISSGRTQEDADNGLAELVEENLLRK
jgi:hypothetical protein